MRNLLNEGRKNWFKGCIAILCLSIAYYLVFFHPNTKLTNMDLSSLLAMFGSVFAFFSTMVIGVFALLTWNSFELRKRAEADLEAIETKKIQAYKMAEDIEKLATKQKEDKVQENIHGIKEDTTRKSSGEDLKKDIQLLLRIYHFEVIYRLIFGGQLEILNNLKAMEKGMPFSMANFIYSTSSASKLNNFSFLQFMKFLEDNKLIKTNEKHIDQEIYITYSITPEGKEFLQYLTQVNIPLTKQPY